jgi:geranylgeranyl reductase family protein
MLKKRDYDVIVVGAGPAGSTTAAYLAKGGAQVALLEKSEFPREKVCGDGLTPRAVKQLHDLGVDTSREKGWLPNRGLRIIGGGQVLELDWPRIPGYPEYGLVRTREDFDEILARHAEASGAHLMTKTRATEPIFDSNERVSGVKVRQSDSSEVIELRSRVVVAADGVSGRLALALGIEKRDDRPMGVAVRTYFRSPRSNDDYLESWLELRDGADLLPGYGWIFGMGDGTANVGLGILNSSPSFQSVDYRDLLRKWLSQTPPEWGLVEENMTQPVRGAALPMGFNRQPTYTRGLMLVGDSGGMVNPFNGEGIAYAMESAALAAEVIQTALAKTSSYQIERELLRYPDLLKARLGGYYTLGRLFVSLISYPEVMQLATKHGLKHDRLMNFTLKLLANLSNPQGGDLSDRTIAALTRLAPAA